MHIFGEHLANPFDTLRPPQLFTWDAETLDELLLPPSKEDCDENEPWPAGNTPKRGGKATLLLLLPLLLLLLLPPTLF